MKSWIIIWNLSLIDLVSLVSLFNILLYFWRSKKKRKRDGFTWVDHPEYSSAGLVVICNQLLHPLAHAGLGNVCINHWFHPTRVGSNLGSSWKLSTTNHAMMGIFQCLSKIQWHISITQPGINEENSRPDNGGKKWNAKLKSNLILGENKKNSCSMNLSDISPWNW